MEQNETRTLWISIGAAVFAVILLYGWAQGKRTSLERKFGQTKTVVVATEDIKEFEVIDESKLQQIERPSEFVEPSALDNPVDAVGQLALAPIKKGEQVLDTKLVLPGKSTGLSMQVSPGKRAVTVPVDEIRGVSKLINPGDRVDIVAAVDDGKGVNKIKKIRTMLQDVPVLATGQSIVDNLPIKIIKGDEDNYEVHNLRVSKEYKTLTLEVSPSDAQVLFFLQASGAPLYMSLRNPNDRFVNPLKTVGINDALNRVIKRKPTKVAKPRPKPKPKPKRRKPRGRFEEL